MAYIKTDWKARKGSNLSRFRKENDTSQSVILHNEPTSVTEPGTPFSTQNMNKIEDGIYSAHEMIAKETTKRISEDERLTEELGNAVNSAVETEALEREKGNSILSKRIDDEVQMLQGDILNLDHKIQQTNDTLNGVKMIRLTGALLTRVFGGSTQVQKSLFSTETIFISGKTLINDIAGTIGVYAGEIDSATVEITTTSTSPSGNETVQHNAVQTHADLPLTIAEAEALGWQTPEVGNYTTVLEDETLGGVPAEWYITFIDGNQNITWGNHRVINLGDYQLAASADMAGMILTAGPVPGTWGTPKKTDIEPNENSGNLLLSGGVWSWFGAARETLKTAAKTAFGAINELFEKKADIAAVSDTDLTPNQSELQKGALYLYQFDNTVKLYMGDSNDAAALLLERDRRTIKIIYTPLTIMPGSGVVQLTAVMLPVQTTPVYWALASGDFTGISLNTSGQLTVNNNAVMGDITVRAYGATGLSVSEYATIKILQRIKPIDKQIYFVENIVNITSPEFMGWNTRVIMGCNGLLFPNGYIDYYFKMNGVIQETQRIYSTSPNYGHTEIDISQFAHMQTIGNTYEITSSLNAYWYVVLKAS